MNIIEAIHDKNLFRPFFRDLTSWAAWFVVLRAIFSLPMDAEERALFQKLTGRANPPAEPVREAWLICGRRGGKSFIVALIGVFLACFRDYSKYLAPGEKGVVMIVASDRKQAQVILNYIKAFLQIPILQRLVLRETADTINLSNRITIQVGTCSYRLIRGYTVVGFLADEVAFWHTDDSANPDTEVIAAVRPSMITIPNSLLIGLSSPYRQKGVLFENYREHFGEDRDDVLVVQADTQTMNPLVDQRIIDDAYVRDPLSAASEYGAQFRTDLADFLDGELIERAVMRGQSELPPHPQITYVAFADPSGGARDSFTLGIAHEEKGTFVLDVCRARRPPFSPDSVVSEYAQLLKTYGLHTVVGDRYALMWVVEAFGKQGINFEHSKRSKSELYMESLPLFSQGAVRLLDRRTLLTELHQLERRTARGGRDSVDHPSGGRDDEANACCGALVEAALGSGRIPQDAIAMSVNRTGVVVSNQRTHGFSAFDGVEEQARQPEWLRQIGGHKLDWDQ